MAMLERIRRTKLQTGAHALQRNPAAPAACTLYFVGEAAKWHDWTEKGAVHRKSCVLESDEDVLRGFAESPKDSVWVTRGTSSLRALAREAVQATGERRLIVLTAMEETTHHVLTTWFRYVVAGKDGITLLERSELVEVLHAPNRGELFVGGAFDHKERVVILYRGTVEPLVVPLDWFRGRHDGPRPDFDRFRVVDYGHTVRLGEFEVASDAILYEFDEDYRKNAKKRFVDADPSLGGALRRLRLQKGLSRADFAPIPIRTIARIERGEVLKPQSSTMRRMAERLRVPVESLPSY